MSNKDARLGRKFNRLCGPIYISKKEDPKDPDSKERFLKVEPGESYWKVKGKEGLRKKPKPDDKYKRPVKKERIKERALTPTERRERNKREQELYNVFVKDCKRHGERVIIGFTKWRKIHRAGVIG